MSVPRSNPKSTRVPVMIAAELWDRIKTLAAQQRPVQSGAQMLELIIRQSLKMFWTRKEK
jgi:hypothetical protein